MYGVLLYGLNIFIVQRIMHFHSDKNIYFKSRKNKFDHIIVYSRLRVLRILNILCTIPFVISASYILIYDTKGVYWNISNYIKFTSPWSLPKNEFQRELFEVANAVYIFNNYYFKYCLIPLCAIFALWLVYYSYKKLRNKQYSKFDIHVLLLEDISYKRGWGAVHIIFASLLFVVMAFVTLDFSLGDVEKERIFWIYSFAEAHIYNGIFDVLKILSLYMLSVVFLFWALCSCYNAIEINYFLKKLNK